MSDGLVMPYHPGRPGQAEIAAVGGAGRGRPEGAAAPLNQSREALLAAWPLHSPEGVMTGTPLEKRVGSGRLGMAGASGPWRGSAVVPRPACGLAFGDLAAGLVIGDDLGDPP